MPRPVARIRHNSGSLFLLMLGVLAFLLTILSISATFFAAFVTHQKLQERAEDLVMRLTKGFNDGDRTGRINNLTAASRELVFNSRQLYAKNANRDFDTLALRYVDEAREGAELVSKEYQCLAKLSLSEARAAVKSVSEDNQRQFVVPWVEMKHYTVVSMDVGGSKDGQSNVVAPKGNEALYEFDKHEKNFDEKTDLYLGNRNLLLPEPDKDLIFRISVLPPSVKKTTPTARLVSAEEFLKVVPVVANGMQAPDAFVYIPCAVQAKLSVDLNSSLDWVNQCVGASATAIGDGGTPLPPVVLLPAQ